MLITNHALMGAMAGLAVPRPLGACVAGVTSHFLVDAVPHWGPGGDSRLFLRVAVTDGLCGLAAAALVWRHTPRSRRTAVVAGMFGACLPDADKPSRLFFGLSPFPARLDQFHARIQRESPTRLGQEALVAAALSAAVAIANARLGRKSWRRV